MSHYFASGGSPGVLRVPSWGFNTPAARAVLLRATGAGALVDSLLSTLDCRCPQLNYRYVPTARTISGGGDILGAA